jgi:SNF2 family DNA or RNA helicase
MDHKEQAWFVASDRDARNEVGNPIPAGSALHRGSAKRCRRGPVMDLRSDLLAGASGAFFDPWQAPRSRGFCSNLRAGSDEPLTRVRESWHARRMIPVITSLTGMDRLQRALAAPPAGPSRQLLSLQAFRLRLRDQFDELLCLSRLTKIRRLDYQVETVLKVLRTFRGRALLADEVGLGKTIEAGMLIAEFVMRGMARRTLVIVPAALVGQWQAELREKFEIEARCSDDVSFRSNPERAWAEATGVVVASLQLVRSARHAPLVREQKWDLVVVDEAHHVKNRETAGYQLIDALKSRYLLLLTATPVENSLDELYNLVTLLKPGQLATPAAFRREFLAKGDPFAPRNRDKLRALLAEVMIRNTRALAGRSIELPPRFAQTVIVVPSPSEQALYDAVVQAIRAAMAAGKTQRFALRGLLEQAGSSAEAVRDAVGRWRADHGSALPELARLHEIACAATSARSTKLARLLELLQSPKRLASGSKTLVFTRFRSTLEAVSQGLTAAGIEHCTFHGGMSGPEKDLAVARLREQVSVMVATEVGGEGRNLQFANVLVNYDLPWNPMKIEQRIGRLHRIGQTREVHVYSFCAQGSAEDRILDVLDRRIHLFELVIGEVDMILGRAMQDQDFEDRVFDIVARAQSEADVSLGFDALAEELARARSDYDKVQALDEALFRRDFET